MKDPITDPTTRKDLMTHVERIVRPVHADWSKLRMRRIDARINHIGINPCPGSVELVNTIRPS